MDLSENKNLIVFGFAVLLLLTLSIAGFASALTNTETQEMDRNDILSSENHSTTVVVFYSDQCMNCDKVRDFVNDEADTYDSVTVKEFEVGSNETNYELYHDSINSGHTGVPAVQVGNETWFGYTVELEDEIRNEISDCSEKACGVPNKYDRTAQRGY